MAQTETLTHAVEEYLEAIHRFATSGDGPTTTGLAEHLDVRPASVTGMLKRLADLGLITYQRYGRIKLTPAGERRAHAIVRRHRLAERLLTDLLEVPLDQVHDEACRLEHALSADVAGRIADKLGDPDLCPHGHPIDAQADDRTLSLLDAPPGRAVAIVRLQDESPEVVRYLSDRALLPKARLRVRAREPLGGGVVVEVGGETHTIGRDLAATIRVTRPRGRRPR
jgi:DtxR family Mn-dependent transcriptional regulator